MEEVLSAEKLPSIIDISLLGAAATEMEVAKLAEYAKEYQFIAAYVMPNNVSRLRKCLSDDQNIIIGATIGFPTGTDLMQDKAFQVKELKKIGCTEFDMVISIGKLKSGCIDYVKEDIQRVIDAAGEYPVKVILEVTYLTDDEIKLGSEIVASSGAEYVKTGTGYAANPTELRHVQLMKKTVGDSVKIKVAGGVRNYSSLQAFYNAGASRFGIGMNSAVHIIEEAKSIQ